MELNLTKLLHQSITINVIIKGRLPSYIPLPCELTCDLKIEPYNRYKLISMDTRGSFVVTCQRCLEDFVYDYQHSNQLAVCRDEETASEQMVNFDCIVSNINTIDITEILTDDLHLFVNSFHPCLSDCSLGG